MTNSCREKEVASEPSGQRRTGVGVQRRGTAFRLRASVRNSQATTHNKPFTLVFLSTGILLLRSSPQPSGSLVSLHSLCFCHFLKSGENYDGRSSLPVTGTEDPLRRPILRVCSGSYGATPALSFCQVSVSFTKQNAKGPVTVVVGKDGRQTLCSATTKKGRGT